MGPSIVYSERTNEELEELFRTIIDDEEFLNVCQQKLEEGDKFNKNDLSSFHFSRNKCDYEEISTNIDKDELKPRIVHEINMSIYYNIEVDRNNSDLTFVQRYINVLPEEKDNLTKKNRFSNLNLPNNIDRLVKIHDSVHHSQQPTKPIPNKKPLVKRRQTYVEPKRRTTISTINETQEYDSAALARIVEQQLEAARRAAAMKNFNPIVNHSARTQPPVDRARFVPPPILTPKIREQTPRHRVDHIQFPQTNSNRFFRKPFTFINNLISQPVVSKPEREKILRLGEQGIISSAMALGSQRIPDNIKTIELLEIPNTQTNTNQYQDFSLVSYETLDDYSIPAPPVIRRAKSMRHINTPSELSTKRSSTIISGIPADSYSQLSSPLKNIRHNIHNKNETTIYNKQVSKEKSKGKKS